MIKYDYLVIKCNGRLNNLVSPECPAVTEGVINEAEELILSAKAEGWTEKGKSDHLCPGCSAKLAPPKDSPKTVRAPRTPRFPDVPSELTDGQ